MKDILHKTAIKAENLWDSLPFGDQAVKSAYIDPFIGYSTPQGIRVRGRVLDGKPSVEPEKPGSAWENIRQMAQRFITNEISGAEVVIAGKGTKSDEEGYFAIDLPELADGASSVSARLPEHGVEVPLPVILTNPVARFGTISDIDDTLIETEAFSLARNIFNTMTGDAASRVVFDDSKSLLTLLSDGGVNPVFYVSSSPWNLHSFLIELFRRNNVVAGPLFLRDLGIDEDKFIKGTHGSHKLSMIDTILEANPGLAFYLIGDTGQHDPGVYLSAIEKYPGRFKAALFRIPDKGLDPEDEDSITKIEAAGIPVYSGQDFCDAIEFVEMQQSGRKV